MENYTGENAKHEKSHISHSFRLISQAVALCFKCSVIVQVLAIHHAHPNKRQPW